MEAPIHQSLTRWSESARNRAWPVRIANQDKAPQSWIFPTPWIDGPEISPGHWEYCCFPLPVAETPVFVKISTTLVDDYGSPHHAHDKHGTVHGEESGFFLTTFHSVFPEPPLPAQYGLEIMSPIEDPEGPAEKTDPAWDGFGQWIGHKIGGAPYLRLDSKDEQPVRELVRAGYEMLIQLEEPAFNLVDPRKCDDYMGEWLFQKHRFCVLLHPETMDLRYIWG